MGTHDPEPHHASVAPAAVTSVATPESVQPYPKIDVEDDDPDGLPRGEATEAGGGMERLDA